MRVRFLKWTVIVAFAIVAVVGGISSRSSVARSNEQPAAVSEKGRFWEYVDAKGNISLPTDYRTRFTHLGTFATASKVGEPVDQLHGVYARPEDVKAFQMDGKFPDGAVVVKEVSKVKSDNLTTGKATWATDVDIWFVMVKDAKGRFQGNDLWGDGWEWALFKEKDPMKQVATDYTTDCRSCHVPAKKDDWLYVRGYPALRDKSAKK